MAILIELPRTASAWELLRPRWEGGCRSHGRRRFGARQDLLCTGETVVGRLGPRLWQRISLLCRLPPCPLSPLPSPVAAPQDGVGCVRVGRGARECLAADVFPFADCCTRPISLSRIPAGLLGFVPSEPYPSPDRHTCVESVTTHLQQPAPPTDDALRFFELPPGAAAGHGSTMRWLLRMSTSQRRHETRKGHLFGFLSTGSPHFRLLLITLQHLLPTSNCLLTPS